MTTSARMITETQEHAIDALHRKLGRAMPELWGLTHEQAGDLIVSLRDELLAKDGA